MRLILLGNQRLLEKNPFWLMPKHIQRDLIPYSLTCEQQNSIGLVTHQMVDRVRSPSAKFLRTGFSFFTCAVVITERNVFLPRQEWQIIPFSDVSSANDCNFHFYCSAPALCHGKC